MLRILNGICRLGQVCTDTGDAAVKALVRVFQQALVRGGVLPVLALGLCGAIGTSCYIEGRTTDELDSGTFNIDDENDDGDASLQASGYPESVTSNCQLFSLRVSLTNDTGAPLSIGAEDGYLLDMVYYTEDDADEDGVPDVERVGGGVINFALQLANGASQNMTFRPFNSMMVGDALHNTNGFENLSQPINKKFGVMLWQLDGLKLESNKFHIDTTSFNKQTTCPDNTEAIQAVELD